MQSEATTEVGVSIGSENLWATTYGGSTLNQSQGDNMIANNFNLGEPGQRRLLEDSLEFIQRVVQFMREQGIEGPTPPASLSQHLALSEG